MFTNIVSLYNNPVKHQYYAPILHMKKPNLQKVNHWPKFTELVNRERAPGPCDFKGSALYNIFRGHRSALPTFHPIPRLEGCPAAPPRKLLLPKLRECCSLSPPIQCDNCGS